MVFLGVGWSVAGGMTAQCVVVIPAGAGMAYISHWIPRPPIPDLPAAGRRGPEFTRRAALCGQIRQFMRERAIFVVIPAQARLHGCTPAWMQVVEPRLEQAAEVVERRREQAAEESSGFIIHARKSGHDKMNKPATPSPA